MTSRPLRFLLDFRILILWILQFSIVEEISIRSNLQDLFQFFFWNERYMAFDVVTAMILEVFPEMISVVSI